MRPFTGQAGRSPAHSIIHNDTMVVASPTKPEKIQRPVVRDIGSFARTDSGTVDESYSPPPTNINVVEHPVAQHALTALRNKHTPTKLFRVFSNQLLAVLALEATRTLPTREETVETPADSHAGSVLASRLFFYRSRARVWASPTPWPTSFPTFRLAPSRSSKAATANTASRGCTW